MSEESRNDWSAFSDQLDQALELSGEPLHAWLDSLRGRDPALARRIEAALQARDAAAAADFLNAPASLLQDAAAATSLRGRRVGPYVVEAEIGQGGMGSVWRARRDDGQFDALVAIKFIHASWIGTAGVQRFRQEGNLLARLIHPNIARLLDAGIFDAAQPYLILEYVAGMPIDEHCRQGGMPVAARIRLFLHALGAVAHAHSHLIIHRDLKPSNILVARDGTVKLLDFGVAKLLDEGNVISPATRASVVALTPMYASPEQLSGDPVTTATDVYSLGMVLYVLLTGTHPFADAAGNAAELITAVTRRTAPRASAGAMPGISARRDLQGDLDNILNKALKKDPAERYATVGAFAEDLQRYLTHQPVLAAPDTLAYRASKFVRRNRAAVAGTAAAILGLLATTSVALWQTHQARLERDAALKAQRQSDAVSEFTSLVLREVGANDAPNALRRQLDRSRLLLHEQHYQDPGITVVLLRQLSSRYAEAGDTTTSIALLEEALVEMAKVEDPEMRAQLHCSLANAYDGLARNEDADRHIRQAVAILDRLGDTVRTEDRADCRVVESYIATAHRQNRRAIQAARTALHEIERAGIRTGDQHITELTALRRALTHAGQNAEAMRLDRAILAEDGPGKATESIWGWIHQYNATNTLFSGGRVLEAEATSTMLLATGDRFNDGGENARDIALLRARILLALARTAQAEPLLDRARGQSGSNPQIDLAVVLAQADAKIQDGELAAAAHLLQSRATAIERAVAQRTSEGLTALRLRALLAWRSGDAVGADAIASQAAGLALDADGAVTTDYLPLIALRAELALARGRAADACRFADLALSQARREAALPSSSAWIGESLLLRARCAQASGDAVASRERATAALGQLIDNLGAQHPLSVAARALSGG